MLLKSQYSCGFKYLQMFNCYNDKVYLLILSIYIMLNTWFQAVCLSVKNVSETYEEESSEHDEEDEERKKANGETGDPLETYRLTEARKKFLLSKIRPFDDSVSTKEGMKNQVLQTYIDYDSAELVSRYLASKRPFSQSFSIYLRQVSLKKNFFWLLVI